MSELQRAAAFKASISRHLAQLSQLAGHAITKEDLLSPEQTEILRGRSKESEYAPAWRWTGEFSEKTGQPFQRLVGQFEELSPGGVYVWTPLSNVCGVLRPISLRSIQWGFDFDLIPEGILVFLAVDLRDKLLLDFAETAETRRVVEIEVAGPHWGAFAKMSHREE